MKKIIFFFVFFTSYVFCNELPELGSSFDNLINQSDEKKIKFQIMQQVFSSNTVIRDSEINDYLSNLGNNLVQNGTKENFKINFFIVNDSSINAFAMLGNIIGVHTGLLFSANTESELASVISHEIAHVTQKHLLRLIDVQAKNSFKSYLALAIAILAARSNPQLATGAVTAASASQTQNMLDYTRSNEREADQIGLEILHKSGFDPKGFIDFFSTLQKFNNFSSGAAPAFLRTHPVTTERISDIQDRLKEYQYLQKENKLEFYLVKAKLKAFIGEYTQISNIFLNEINQKTYLSEPASYFGLVYSYIRQNKILDARSSFNKLKKFNLISPMIMELEANLLIAEGAHKDALFLYQKAIEKYPYHKAFVFGLSTILLNYSEQDKAIKLLNKYLLFFDKDPTIYELLAKAYNRKGEFLLEHENLSDAYYYKYDIQNAISQMDIATKINSDNFFDQSRVEHRLKELKRESKLMDF